MRTAIAPVFLALVMLVVGCRPARWVELEPDHASFAFSMPAQPMEKPPNIDLPLGHINTTASFTTYACRGDSLGCLA
jgi:hypothetical protein